MRACMCETAPVSKKHHRAKVFVCKRLVSVCVSKYVCVKVHADKRISAQKNLYVTALRKRISAYKRVCVKAYLCKGTCVNVPASKTFSLQNRLRVKEFASSSTCV